MIATSEDAAVLLRSGGYQGEWVVDVVVDGDRKLVDVPVNLRSFSSSGNRKVRGQGRFVLTYSDELGQSILPETLTSWLTPYATVISLSYRMVAAAFTEKVLVGTFKVTRITDAVDSRLPFQGRYISVGSSVGVEFMDLFHVTNRERFPIPYGPVDLSSVWREIGLLTGLPLLRSVPDAQIPRSVTYKENRLDAVFDLARVIGGIPFVNENGQVSVEPDSWADPSEGFGSGSDGVVISRSFSDLSDDGIYNQVVVRSYDSGQGSILATRELADGPLRYGGPFGRVPYFASSQFVVTAEQAAAYAEELLPQVSSVPAIQFELEVVPDPRRQVGDVVPFEWDGYSWLGRIRELRLSSSGPMAVRVEGRLLGPVGEEEEAFAGYGEGSYGGGGYGT